MYELGSWLAEFGVSTGQIVLIVSVHMHLLMFRAKFQKITGDVKALQIAIRPKAVLHHE